MDHLEEDFYDCVRYLNCGSAIKRCCIINEALRKGILRISTITRNVCNREWLLE